MSTIGTTVITGATSLIDGAPVQLEAICYGDADQISVSWSGPPGCTAPLASESSTLGWRFNAASDAGVYRATISDPSSSDSPQVVEVELLAIRTLNRFGRIYQAFDPDGAGPGPSTWILIGPGSSGGGGDGNSLHDTLTAIVGPTPNPIQVGQVLRMNDDGTVNLADNNDYRSSLVIGLAVTTAVAGARVHYIQDGVVILQDWRAVLGVSALEPGRRYFLARNGQLSLASPSVGYAAPVGRALSASQLEVEIGTMPIKAG